jgi:alpha-glucosidase
MHHWQDSIHHDGSPNYVQTDGRLGGTATLRLRVGAGAPVEAAFLRACPDGEQQITPLHLEAPEAGSVCRWLRAEAPVRMLRTGYRFLLRTAAGNLWYNGLGLTRSSPTDANDFKLLAAYHAPAWVRDAVFYQIFPDRFADGDPANNVRSGAYNYGGKPVVARTWGELPQKASGPREFFGGDLQLARRKLAAQAELCQPAPARADVRRPRRNYALLAARRHGDGCRRPPAGEQRECADLGGGCSDPMNR